MEVRCIRDDGSTFIGEVLSLAPGSLCWISHDCAICGKAALHAGHGTRGGNWRSEGRSDCPENFKVRCGVCTKENRKPEPPLLLAVELEWNFEGEAMLEALKCRNADPNIVYEVM